MARSSTVKAAQPIAAEIRGVNACVEFIMIPLLAKPAYRRIGGQGIYGK
jgi:hypothetical protein